MLSQFLRSFFHGKNVVPVVKILTEKTERIRYAESVKFYEMGNDLENSSQHKGMSTEHRKNYMDSNRLVTRVILIDQSINQSKHLQSGPKKRYPGFNFAITSVNVHRF